MNVSYNWLKELVDFEWSAKELAHRLTLSGISVESVQYIGEKWDKILVGEIVQISPHPHNQRLLVCKVKTGKEVLQVVCGATNIKVKAKVPLAPVNTVLPDGRRIQKESFEGIDSSGMLCSAKELSLGEDASGILILDDRVRSGVSITEALNLKDWVLSLDLTTNRPDCLSIIGVAREVSAISGKRLKKPAFKVREVSEPAKRWVKVRQENIKDCPRYAARIITEVKIGLSPLWMSQRLEALGVRSINNVVDITNYVMLEYGHPLHAFDYDLFSGKKVYVRRAKEKEKFSTLDRQEHQLNKNILLITDGQTPTAVAGIMGGLLSEVSQKTKTVLLESAYFNPFLIRQGRLQLGLVTESSTRFERGADPNIVDIVCNRAAFLISRLCQGKILKGIVDSYPKKISPLKIFLRPERVNQILGLEIKTPRTKSILQGLEFKVQSGKKLTVTVPTFRPDITREIDLIEEVARIYGYDKIPVTLEIKGQASLDEPGLFRMINKAKQILSGMGLNEVVTNSLVDPSRLVKIGFEEPYLRIQNPLSPEMSVLRPSLLYNLLSTVAWNKNRKEEDLRIFEIGKVFRPKAKNTLPEEKFHLGIALSGKCNPPNWQAEEEKFNFYDLKGIWEVLGQKLDTEKTEFKPENGNRFATGQGFTITHSKAALLGTAGEISTGILKELDIKEPVFVLEIDFEKIADLIQNQKEYRPLPKFPPADRDIAIILDEGILSMEIEKAIWQNGEGLIEEVRLFDLYRGEQIPEGKKSLAFSIRYRSDEKTLTDEEVDSLQEKIINSLAEKFGAVIRR